MTDPEYTKHDLLMIDGFRDQIAKAERKLRNNRDPNKIEILAQNVKTQRALGREQYPLEDWN